MVSEKIILLKKSHVKFLTNSCSPRSSITRTILAPIEPPIEHPFRNAARIKIGMLVLIVKITATIKWSKVQKIANVFILKWRERYPKMGRAMALIGCQTWSHKTQIIEFTHEMSNQRTPDLHQQTQTSTCMRFGLKSYHTESLRLLIVSLLQGHNVLPPFVSQLLKCSETRLSWWFHSNPRCENKLSGST